MRPSCTATMLVDAARVSVTRFDFAPGVVTGWHGHRNGHGHLHGHDYMITAITDCPMRLEEPGGGTRTVRVPAGTAYRRSEGAEHNVVNDGSVLMSFVEVELKEAEGPGLWPLSCLQRHQSTHDQFVILDLRQARDGCDGDNACRLDPDRNGAAVVGVVGG
jgi:beta-alanine degradation protein BauB